MLKQRFLQNRADRIVALGRVVLAASAAVAASLDSPSPAAYRFLVEPMLIGYLVLAIAFTAVVWLRPLSSRPLGSWAHAADIGVVATLIYVTAGASSPFFPLFLFTILSATLKWSWRGALWTTAVVLAVFLPTGFVQSLTIDPARDDLARYIVRVAQVPVIGGLLAYFGAQRERIWNELAQLSRAVDPRGAVSLEEWIRACLSHTCDFFAAERVIFAWESLDEPGLRAFQLDGEAMRELPAPSEMPLVVGAPEGAFDFDSASAQSHIYRDNGTLEALPGSPLNRNVAFVWNVSQAVVASVKCDALRGWLIIVKNPRDEDLHLARAVSVQIASALDHAAAAEAWRAAAASEERIRLARDLHDGILQFLTGLSLQFKLVEQEARSNPEAAAERVGRLQSALRTEQQDLRAFVEGLRPRGAPQPGAATHLQSLCQLLSHQWDIAVDADVPDEPPPEIAAEVRQIVREATANAVRHGRARSVRLRAHRKENDYSIELADDGDGFGRDGMFDISTLRSSGFGPRTLLERVERLGGTLLLRSSTTGAAFSITLPIKVRYHA